LHSPYYTVSESTRPVHHQARGERASDHLGAGGRCCQQRPRDRGAARRNQWDTESNLPLLGRFGRRLRNRHPLPREL